MEPERKAVVQRTSKHHNASFEMDVSNGHTTMRPWTSDQRAYLSSVIQDTWSIRAGEEDALIAMLIWVKEERARWAALALNDRAEV